MRTSRRSFLGLAATGAAIGLTGCQSPRRRPRDPDQPARLMIVGVAGRGGENLTAVANQHIELLCDVDRRHLEAAGAKFPRARICADYRTVLHDPVEVERLDGVVISTPDHTHYLPAMLALQQGLDVYCEKPLTQTIAQARRLCTVAEQNGCVTQMGTQIHANANYRRVVEAIAAGAVGVVREVVVFVNGTDWSATRLPDPQQTPAFLDWNLWLGPTPHRPFSAGYHPMGWRRYWAFGGGTTADMACHYVDLAFWALDLDAPTSLLADGLEPDAECAPAALRCEYAFPARGQRAPLVLRWHAGKDRPAETLAKYGLEKWQNGVLFVGDDGWLVSDYNRHEIGPAARKAAWQAPPQTIAASPGHQKEWLLGSALRTRPSCSFRVCGPADRDRAARERGAARRAWPPPAVGRGPRCARTTMRRTRCSTCRRALASRSRAASGADASQDARRPRAGAASRPR